MCWRNLFPRLETNEQYKLCGDCRYAVMKRNELGHDVYYCSKKGLLTEASRGCKKIAWDLFYKLFG